ncbi:LTA synthase family protein [Pseudalkalibacillus salsuginis]|uniref:LTA synthase family protein n=1 Tax=Pseudalkalibacillus salsuginis TaxID=2910972 RepID=UPI001F24F31B|nr:LTA synthase family protein [Pseudalkalibacillus salsuginis]MCF6410091.1 LTA synthase family protein [Pseudalkalibacillus salsuginis]
MDILLKWLKKSSLTLLGFSDYFLFVLLIMVKLYIFAIMTETIFVPQGAVGYIKDVITFLISDTPESNLRAGLVMVSFGSILIISFWTLLLKGKKRWISLLALDGLLTFIILADTVYYRYFEDIISSTVLMQFRQVSSLGSSISNLFSWSDLLFVIDLIILIPVVILGIKWSEGNLCSSIWMRMTTAIMALMIGIFCTYYPIKVFLGFGGSWLFEKTLSNMRVYDLTGLLGFHGYDTYRFISESLESKTVSTERKEEIQDWLLKHQEVLSTESDYYGISEGKNVIIIQLEAFQSMLIDEKVNGREITPNLNKLKKESMNFTNFYDQTASGRTSDAEFLLNTSLYPLPSGSAYIKHSGNEFSSMPALFKKEGFSTEVFHAYKPSFWNRYMMYQTLGFDKFNSLEDFKETEMIGWSISDKAFLNQSAEMMEKQKKPSYSFLITLTSHYPYEFPEKYKKLDLSGLNDETFKNYLQSTHYVDEAMGEFVQKLKDQGAWNDSVVMLFGDHDSGLMAEDGEMAKFMKVDKNKTEYLKEKERLPLMIRLPDGEKAGTYDKTIGHIDLGPTLMHLLGIDMSKEYMIGTPAFVEHQNNVVFRSGSFITDEVLYKASIDGDFESGSCYDLKLKEKINLVNCQEPYEKAVNQLQMSDQILGSDLIREYRKNEL